LQWIDASNKRRAKGQAAGWIDMQKQVKQLAGIGFWKVKVAEENVDRICLDLPTMQSQTTSQPIKLKSTNNKIVNRNKNKNKSQ
jgi:hypothetical protein